MRFYSILPFDCFPFISFLFIVSEFFIPISWVGRTLLPISTYSYFFVPSSILLETIKYLFGIYVKFYASLQQKLWTLLLQTRVRVLSFTTIVQVPFFLPFSVYIPSPGIPCWIIDASRALHEKLTSARITFRIYTPFKGWQCFSKWLRSSSSVNAIFVWYCSDLSDFGFMAENWYLLHFLTFLGICEFILFQFGSYPMYFNNLSLFGVNALRCLFSCEWFNNHAMGVD